MNSDVLSLAIYSARGHLTTFVFCRFMFADEVGLSCDLARYEKIMREVDEHFQEEYGQTIHDRIEKEVGGKCRRLLQNMVEFSKKH